MSIQFCSCNQLSFSYRFGVFSMRAFISTAIIIVSAVSFSNASFAKTPATSKKTHTAVENANTVPTKQVTPAEAPKNAKQIVAQPTEAKPVNTKAALATKKHKTVKAKAHSTDKKAHE